MYPRVEINIDGIKENINKLSKLCKKNSLSLNIVTKMLANNKYIVSEMCKCKIDSISDSRIDNLKNFDSLDIEKWLIREPMFCEIEDVIRYCDASFNSELETIILLNEEAKRQGVIHKIILTYELGDLREGLNKEDLKYTIDKSKNLSNIKIYGIAANLSCYGGTVPSSDNMNELAGIKNEIEKECNIKLEVVSGCSSISIKYLKDKSLPSEINNIRSGEAVYLGLIPSYNEKIEGFNYDNFILKAQIVEIQEKPSIPRGEILKDSFGNIPSFVDRGVRQRALIAIGKQDTDLGLTPIDENIILLGGSSDYLIVDITDSNNNYKVGDILSFIPDYSSALRLMTSMYVKKGYKYNNEKN